MMTTISEIFSQKEVPVCNLDVKKEMLEVGHPSFSAGLALAHSCGRECEFVTHGK